MNDCPNNEHPSSILSEARDYGGRFSTSTFSKVQAETALRLAEVAYSDSQGKPGDRSMAFAPAQKHVDDNSGFFGIPTDAEVQSRVAIELAKVAHFDKMQNPQTADQSIAAAQSLAAAQKIVDKQYSSLSWDAYTLTETAIGLAKANHLDAQDKPDEARKAFDEVTQSMGKLTSHLTWGGVAARDVAIDLAKFKFFDRHDQPKDADAALQAAQVDSVKNNGFAGPNNDTIFKLAAAVSIAQAARLAHRGDCNSANQIVHELAKKAENDRGMFFGTFSNDAAIKVHSAIAVAKIGIQTGQDVTPALSLLLTEHAMVDDGDDGKMAR